jgi:hypothetical protein
MKTAEAANLNKSFIHDLLIEKGDITTINVIRNCFGEDMNFEIKDSILRILLWQLTHSLSKLEEETNQTFTDISSIEQLAQNPDTTMAQIIARHIINALDNLSNHVT